MLYLLKLKTKKVFYDISYGYVVRAKNADQARKLACSFGGDNSSDWVDPTRTSCRILKSKGPYGVILKDFNAG